MKNLLLFIICICINTVGFGQIIATEYDEVSPFIEDLSAVRNGDTWGFINKEGNMAVDFRDDIALSSESLVPYPVFNNNRCLIKRLINNAYYYGYINDKGKEVIPPQYLNASNFKDGYAIVIKLLKDTIGYNEVFKKPLTTYKLEEFIIDVSGETVRYLENPIIYIPPKITQTTPPEFHSKFIAPHIVAVQKKNMKWDIYEF